MRSPDRSRRSRGARRLPRRPRAPSPAEAREAANGSAPAWPAASYHYLRCFGFCSQRPGPGEERLQVLVDELWYLLCRTPRVLTGIQFGLGCGGGDARKGGIGREPDQQVV